MKTKKTVAMTGAAGLAGCLVIGALVAVLGGATILAEAAAIYFGWNLGVVPLFHAHPIGSFGPVLLFTVFVNLLIAFLRLMFGTAGK